MSYPTDRVRAGYTVTITDPGKDPDDEDVMILFGSLVTHGFVHLAAYIANLAPATERAKLLSGSMRTIGLAHVPFGAGTNCTRDADSDKYADQFVDTPYMGNMGYVEDGVEVLKRTYAKATSKSITLLLISGLTDAWNLLKSDPQGFVQKTKKVVLMGGVTINKDAKTPEEAIFIDSDGHMTADAGAANNKDDYDSASRFYKECQKLGIKIIVLARPAAYAVPFSSDLYRELAMTGHPMGIKLNDMQGRLLNELWTNANRPTHVDPDGDVVMLKDKPLNQHTCPYCKNDIGPKKEDRGCALCRPWNDNPERKGLPARCNRTWFLSTFTDENPKTCEVSGKDPIFHLVTQIYLYDPLTAIASIDALREQFFCPLTITITADDGSQVDHEIIGIKKSPEPEWNGVILPGFLRSFVWDQMMWSLLITIEVATEVVQEAV